MNSLINFILISIWPLVACSISQLDIDSVPCGQYGFRCIDERFFQVCSYTDSDGQTEQPDIVHECQDKNICDEDNPAFCVPGNFRIGMKNEKNVGKRTDGKNGDISRRLNATKQMRQKETKSTKISEITVEENQDISTSISACDEYGVYAGRIHFLFCTYCVKYTLLFLFLNMYK